MRVDIIDTFDSLAQVRDNWERVYRADPEAHYFLSWTWIANWFEPRPGRWLVLAAKPDDAAADYVAFFPLSLDSQLDEEGNFRHSIRLAGSDFAAYAGILCDPENQTSTLQAFGEHIRSLNWAHFHIDNVFVSESRLRTLLQSFPPSNFVVKKKVRPSHVTDTGEDIDHDVNVFVKLPEDWDEFLATNLGPKKRRNARNFLRKVDAGDEYRVSVADADTIERDLETFLRLWQIQWESKSPAEAQYILLNARHMIRRCFDDGTIFMPVFWKGEDPIGVHIAFADSEKRTLIAFLGSRDLGVRKPWPGFVLHAYSIRWAIANGFTTYDLGTGNFAYKYSFGGEERIVESWFVCTRSGTNLHAPLDRRYLPLAMKLTQAHHAAGNLFRAGQGCRTILAFDPGIGTARTLLESIESGPTAMMANANTLFKRNKFAEAQRVCEEILVRDPENLEAHHVLGATLVMRGLAKEAEGHIRHTIERRPDFASAHNNLGLALAALECMPEALASYDQALALRPDYARAFYNRGEVLRKMGRLGEAIESFESAVAIRPDYGKAIASLRGLIVSERNILPNEYFEMYAGGVKYGEHWGKDIHDHSAFMKAWDRVFADNGRTEPEQFYVNSLLDVGAATGELMKLFSDDPLFDIRNIRGIENSPWAKENVLPEFKERIVFADWLDISKDYPDNSFDMVIDCVGMYIPSQHLDQHLKECARISRLGGVCLICFSEDADDYYPDPWRVTTESKQWWLDKMYDTEQVQFSGLYRNVLVWGV